MEETFEVGVSALSSTKQDFYFDTKPNLSSKNYFFRSPHNFLDFFWTWILVWNLRSRLVETSKMREPKLKNLLYAFENYGEVQNV